MPTTPQQEPSATPSTLERLVDELNSEVRRITAINIEENRPHTMPTLLVWQFLSRLAALRPSEGPPQVYRAQDGRLPELEIVASEGPETGRHGTSVDAIVRDRETGDIYKVALMTLGGVSLSKSEPNGISSRWVSDDLFKRNFEAMPVAALPAGPETGDRERLRVLARQLQSAKHWEWVNGFQNGEFGSADGHSVEDYDTCQHWACVLVRQAAPAAAPAPAQAEGWQQKTTGDCRADAEIRRPQHR